MSLLELTREYVDLAVSTASSPSNSAIKSLLLDADAMAAVTVAHPMSALMSKGVYLFEKLEDPKDTRSRLPFVSCLVLAAPTEANVGLIKKEIANPRFGKYHIFVTGRLPGAAVKSLAEADTREVVETLMELPLAFRPLADHLFLGKAATNVLSSLVDCLDMRPTVCHVKASDACRTLAQQLAHHFRAQGRFENGGGRSPPLLVLLFDRRLDPVTPMLNQWTYQAMIHEVFGIKNNLVQLPGKEGKVEQVKVSAEDDEFFRENLYKNFGEIGEVLRTLVAAYQDRVSAQKANIDSVSDIKDFVASYPEFQKLSGTVSKHVNLLGEISRHVTDHGLLDVSECEQNLCGNLSSGTSSTDADVAGLLQRRRDLRRIDVYRLLGLLFLSRQCKMSLEGQEVNIACKVHGIPRRDVERLFRHLRDFAMLDCLTSTSRLNQLRTPSGAQAATTELLRNSGRKIFRGLRGAENVFTQHEPVLTQILTGLVRNGSSPAVTFDTESPAPQSPIRNILLYAVGGLTYEEAKAVRDLNSSLGCAVVAGGDRMWRSQDFIDSLLKDD